MKESLLGVLVFVVVTALGGCSRRTESPTTTTIVSDALVGDIERVDRWLQLGVPIEYHELSALKRTPLIAALEGGDLRMVSHLLAKGANPNAADANGRTPLRWALMSSCDSNIVDLLLRYGADPSLTDKWGQAPTDDGAWQYYVWMRSNIFLTNISGWRNRIVSGASTTNRGSSMGGSSGKETLRP